MPRRTGLEITLRARTKELERDLKQGRKIQTREIAAMQKKIDQANKKVERQAKRSASRLQKIFKGASGSKIAEIATGQFISDSALKLVGNAMRLVTNQVREMYESIGRVDELSKMSRNLGLNFEALQALRTSFAEGGVAATAFIKSISKFNTVIGEAAAGELEYKEIFDGLNISVRNANGSVKDTETLMYEVADAMQNLGLSAAQQATAVKDLFGIRQGLKFLDIMKQGPEHMRRMMENAERTGRVLKERVGRALEEIDNHQTVINHQIETKAAVAMANWATEAKALASIWGAIKGAIIDTIGWLGKFIGSDYAGLTDAELTEDREDSLKEIVRLERKLKEVAAGKDSEKRTLHLISLTRRLANQKKVLLDIEEALGLRSKKTDETILTGTSTASVKADEKRAKDEYSMMAEGQDLLGNMNAKYEIEQEKEARKEILDIRKKENEVMAEGQRLLQEMNDQVELERMDEKNEKIQEMTDLIDNEFGSALDGVIEGTKSAKEAFADMAKSIILEITKMIAKQLIFNALAAIFPGGATAGGGFSIGKAIGLARGGTFQAGQPIEVGEQGREIMIPSVSGRVLSRAQAQQAVSGATGGGVVVNQNLNFAVGIADTVRAEMENMKPEFVESAKMGVLEAKQRGAMSSAFQ